MTLYHYFFYKIAVLARKINKKNEGFADSAFLFVSTCLVLNLLTLQGILEYFLKVKSISRYFTIILVLLVLKINHSILVKNGKDRIIIEHYDLEYKTIRQKALKNLIIIVYLIITFGLLIFIGRIVRGKW
jgi:uncharacterized membrane protein